MKFMLLKIMMLMSIMMPMMKTPLSMGSILLTQTILTSMLMNSMSTTAWFCMITFMMMIGGMMILFMYMSSIASNEKFKMNINITMLMLMTTIYTEDLLSENQIMENEYFNKIENQEMISMTKLYNKKSLLLTMFMVMFLLLTMISVSKIVMHHKGPLRMKTYE
uniref:NADH dehydrogenase subunit 6 n=1 Tax=Pedionis sagittata TaxID=1754001 RepID=UPI0024115728|nr:NADH dehydrogenase subunit 6 [Pedionis sagittata]WEP24768.1 NADH dehydrogenase subunit 6 [Pedionis sagittata]